MKKTSEEIKKICDLYENIFIKQVENKFGIGYELSAKKLLPMLVKNYFDYNVPLDITDYFDIVIKKTNLIKKEKKQMYLYYAEKIYCVFKDFNVDNLFSDEELKELSLKLSLYCLNKYYKTNKNTPFSAYMISRINCITKSLLNNEDRLITFYVTFVGKTDKIENYLVNKYFYICEKYLNNNVDLFRQILNDILSLPNLTRVKILSRLLKKVNKKNSNKKPKQKMDLSMVRNQDNIKEQLIRSYYSYMQDKKHKYKFYDDKNIVDENLKEILEKTVDSYLNGNSKKYPSSYITTVLSKRLKFYQNRTIKEKYLAKIIEITKDYIDVLDDYYKNKNLSYTKKGQIEEYMNLILEEYIENGSYEIDNKKYFKQMINNYEEIEKIVGDSYEYKFKNQRSKRNKKSKII